MSLPVVAKQLHNVLTNRSFDINTTEDDGGCPLQYHLDCAAEMTDISLDTYCYFLYVHDNPKFFEGFADEHLFEPFTTERHLSRLASMGAHLEKQYEEWRENNPHLRKFISAYALNFFKSQYTEAYKHFKHLLNFQKITHFSDLDKETQATKTMGVLQRCYDRICADLAGMSPKDIVEMNRVGIESHAVAIVERLKQGQLASLDAVIERFQNGDLPNEVRDRIRAIDYVRAQKKRKGILKRSLKLLSSVVGEDKTRMFVSTGEIRFEGEYANYSLRKKSMLLEANGHSSSVLSAFSKKGDIHLCDLCIYTDNVPLADHVASLAMHLRAGEEEEILRIGNFFNITHIEPWMYGFDNKRHLDLAQDRIDGIAPINPKDIIPSREQVLAEIKKNNPPRVLKRRARLQNKAMKIVHHGYLKTVFANNSPAFLYDFEAKTAGTRLMVYA